MKILIALLVALGLAQQTVAQFDDPDVNSLFRNLIELDDGSGSDRQNIFSQEDLITDTPSLRCGANSWGMDCQYPQFPYEPVVPMDQWKDVIPGGKKICSTFDKNYIMTYDQAVVYYSGRCETLLSALCDSPGSPSVWIHRSADCDDCLHHLLIKTGEDLIKIEDVITINGEKSTKSLPFSYKNVDFKKENDFLIISIPQAQVTFNYKDSIVRVHTSSLLSSRLCGLCGNMNGIKEDDITERGEPANIVKRDPKCVETSIPPDLSDEMQRCMNLDSTRRICNIFLSELFDKCVIVRDPTPFYEICLHDICSGDTEVEAGLMCDIVSEYADQCTLNGGTPKEWRGTARCLKHCDAGMDWSECKDLTRTCASAHLNFITTHCEAGCQCDSGKYLQEGRCLALEDCKCFKDHKFYAPGFVRKEACNNTCTCESGKWTCTDYQCRGIAAAYGRFRFHTFDGKNYQIKDTCSYVLSKECSNEFSVVVTTAMDSDGTYHKEASIFVHVPGSGKHIYSLRRNGMLEMQSKMTHEAPFQNGVVMFHRYSSFGVKLTLVGKDVHILYDRDRMIMVSVPLGYQERMCGLGGNFNGILHDDFMLKSKMTADMDTFVEDWKIGQTKCKAISDIGIVQDCIGRSALRICESIFQYSTCGSMVIANQQCRRDVCAAPSDERALEVACSGVRAYARACIEKGYSDIAPFTSDECVVSCPESFEYQEYGSDCTSSCAVFSTHCTTQVYAGCFCPEGTYRNDEGYCVEKSDCPCYSDGTWYEQGPVKSIANQDCVCSGGELTCTEINSTMSCPSPNMVYYQCGEQEFEMSNCEQTCSDVNGFCYSESCVSGCVCIPGFFRTPEGTCVPEEECGCDSQGKYYAHGETLKKDCNTCTCKGGIFECTDLVCPKTCWTVGGAHYQTFDGRVYDFDGDCEYILATDDCSDSSDRLFTIITKNVKCGSSGMTCSRSVTITVKNKRITLERDVEPIIETLYAARSRRAITGYTDHKTAEIFTIKQKGLFTVIDTCIGMTILWDNATRIYIRLTEEWQGKTCGLCGNYDGRDANDYALSTGEHSEDVFEFGNSWKFPLLTSTCADASLSTLVNGTCQNLARKEWAMERCNVIMDKQGVFAPCHTKIDAQAYFDLCVNDACGCDGGGDCECLCTAIGHFAHQCAQEGIPIDWRSNDLCPIMCEKYNDDEDLCLWHYRPCETCITDTCCSCLRAEDSHWCVEGCFPKCPAGYILDEMTQKCIEESKRVAECTWYSVENMCHTCKPCNVCKTEDGATLSVMPGERKVSPLGTDTCEVETCANETSGDLCYNGNIHLLECKKIPIVPIAYERFHRVTCVNDTTSECGNCRNCTIECIIREDSCDSDRVIGNKWRRHFEFDPVPKIGPKTYCIDYKCIEHPLTKAPICTKQIEERVSCTQNISEMICEYPSVLKITPTGDKCCPEEYHCECELCALQTQDGKVIYDKTIDPGETKEWCGDESVSNCCYSDVCTKRPNTTDAAICHVMTRTQAPCTTGPAPTCATGYIWVNKTRPGDCCPWGECECDSCSVYDAFSNRVLKSIGENWTIDCNRFECQRTERMLDGCWKPVPPVKIPCPEDPTCPENQHLSYDGKDECGCPIPRCFCYDQCIVEVNGVNRTYAIGTKFTGEDGCVDECYDPRQESGDENDCPKPRDSCAEPDPCPECTYFDHYETICDMCNKSVCLPIEKCPEIKCDFPYVRIIDEEAEPCKAPCYDCVCKDCLDGERTYSVGQNYSRTVYEPKLQCEDCVCTSELDDDGCKKEMCTVRPCPPVEECEAPYDTPVYEKSDCGCTVLRACICNHCLFNGDVLDSRLPGDTWTVGNTDLGCFDTYVCESFKLAGKDQECYNVTKTSNSCPNLTICNSNQISVKDEEKSCCWDDGVCCDKNKCLCNKCVFGNVSYEHGQNWTKDCIDYTCTINSKLEEATQRCVTSFTEVKCPPEPECSDCYVKVRVQERVVPEYCCPIFKCEPRLTCLRDDAVTVQNGSIWQPEDCKRYQCIVSEEDWANGICPSKVRIDHCDPDPFKCPVCMKEVIVQDSCNCSKVTCESLDEPISCAEPTENQIIAAFETADACLPNKNCCICDDACYYGKKRMDLFSIWWDKAACKRMRCVPPAKTITALGLDDFDSFDVENYDAIAAIQARLSYRKMLKDSKVAQKLYESCSQDLTLCPEARDIGCPKPTECKQCEISTESEDECGCPVITCSPVVCKNQQPINCTLPKNVLLNSTTGDECCKWKLGCICPDGCYDKSGGVRKVGDKWVEEGENLCGRSLTRMTCREPISSEEACPVPEIVPCDPPTECARCKNKTSIIDDYCCEIVTCNPLNLPNHCVEPAKNQFVSSVETGDECFASKNCCVCDTTCTYKSEKYELFDYWNDAEACSRMRCVLPGETLSALGYDTKFDFKNVDDKDMLAILTKIRNKVNFRDMLKKAGVSQKIYDECRQDINLCPKAIDIGCAPMEKCGECYETIVVQDECGCNVSKCELIQRCPMPMCVYPYTIKEIPSDPCKAPCYDCTCETCFDNIGGSTHEIGKTWNRTQTDPELKCETCTCTNDTDEVDGCYRENCVTDPCPVVENCTAPYNKAVYGQDSCGCKKLLHCECTQCMYNGEIVKGKEQGDTWRVGDIKLGCYDTYFCDPIKAEGNHLECFEVTKVRNSCPNATVCESGQISVKDEEKSCCFDDEECCEVNKCICNVCEFGNVTYKDGETWSKDCIDYTCVINDDYHESSMRCTVTHVDVPCVDPKPVCEDCYSEYLKHARQVPEYCCPVYDCQPELYCLNEKGIRVNNGTVWEPGNCRRVECFVTKEDWEKGVCAEVRNVTFCDEDTTECPECRNRTIVKDECDCDKVQCVPFKPPLQCEAKAENQIVKVLETEDACFPSRNCCLCDNACYYKGVRKELFDVWEDKAACKRMRCVLPSDTLLTLIDGVVDYKDLGNNSFWEDLKKKLDYRQMLLATKKVGKLYQECLQDINLCPESLDIGCPEPEPCGDCMVTTTTTNECGCQEITCAPVQCPPEGMNAKECTPPKVLKERPIIDECCKTGNFCVCELGCRSSSGELMKIGEEWDESVEFVCSADPSVKGSVVRNRCVLGQVVKVTASRRKREIEEEVCPKIDVVPCDEPKECKACEKAIISYDERCCTVVTCEKIKCSINIAEDCIAPNITLKSDAIVTGDECCPKYCTCPDGCTDPQTKEKYYPDNIWVHPRSACWNRVCKLDLARVINGGCPYIVNQTICTEPSACEDCYTAVDTIDECGCTQRTCKRNPCPDFKCEDECEEIYDTLETDECSCPIYGCKHKPCPVKLESCEDPEKDVYSWMNLEVDRCCKQYGCRCNYTKCIKTECPVGQVAIRNVSAVKCCCPEHICVPVVDSGCKDYNGVPRKIGVPWVNKDNQCKMLQCSYENVKQRTYVIEEFDRYICSSEKPVCSNSGVPYLAKTKNGCCQEWVCPCVCQVYGDPHYTTFDGVSYDYQGKCTYTLMKEYRFNETEVIVDNELCKWLSARRKDLSCLKTMTVLHKGVNYTFTYGNDFLRNGIKIATRKPWTSDDGAIVVREFGYKKLKIEIAHLGLTILYKTRSWMQSFLLTVNYETYEGKMEGLCGTCNNDPTDEFRTRSRKIIIPKSKYDIESYDKFGESWIKGVADYDQPKCFPAEPECADESNYPDCPEALPSDECIDCSNRCHLRHAKCDPCPNNPCQILRTNPVFKVAAKLYDPSIYISKCVYDLSLMVNSTDVRCDACNSASIAQYASLCELAGVCMPWRSALNCTTQPPIKSCEQPKWCHDRSDNMECPANQEFRECELDAKRDLSCDTPVLNVTASLNVAGCFCPEGMIRKTANSEECILPKCCSGCCSPPKCEDGTAAIANEETDECGCSTYSCSGTKGCTVETKNQLLEMVVNGKNCQSAESVTITGCSGNCAVATRTVEGLLVSDCSTCKPTSTTTRMVSLTCEDDTVTEVEYDTIDACECASTVCR